MKLDRNTSKDGRGKYALLKLRVVRQLERENDFAVDNWIEALFSRGVVDFGNEPGSEFFVIRLKDRFALPALKAYANAVFNAACDERNSGLHEYAHEIERLAWLAADRDDRQTPD